MKILLAKTFEATKGIEVEATVEAEYGSNVVKGKLATLAHHVEEYKHMPAPCVQTVEPLPESSTILISHIDLDTLGGIMRLMNLDIVTNEDNQGFWKAVEFIDLNGSHHLKEVQEYEIFFKAYWAWVGKEKIDHSLELQDVTDVVLEHIETLTLILNKDKKLIEQGILQYEVNQRKIEKTLIEETKDVRIFSGPHFSAAAYYSPKLDSVASVTISFNTMSKSITVATSDNSFDCCELMQSLFGDKAGGHKSIAGTPRGKEMKLKDLYQVAEKVNLTMKGMILND